MIVSNHVKYNWSDSVGLRRIMNEIVKAKYTEYIDIEMEKIDFKDIAADIAREKMSGVFYKKRGYGQY